MVERRVAFKGVDIDSAEEQEQPPSLLDKDDESESSVPPLLQQAKSRPQSARASTEPTPSTLLQSHSSRNPRPSSSQGRNKSPYSRSHRRSRSSGSALSAPPMARAHSMPTVHTSRAFDSSSSGTTPSSSLSPSPGTASPMRSPARVRSPARFPAEEQVTYNPPPRSPGWQLDGASSMGNGAIESIQEDSELELSPRPPLMPQPAPYRAASLGQRRRPASPLHNLQNASSSTTTPPTSIPSSNTFDHNLSSMAIAMATTSSSTSSGSNSPAFGPQKYNEAFPSLHHYASTSSFTSSIPSTPTSARSRSPSISSLDTIEDAPDLESEAVEVERMERLKIAAERAERAERGEDVMEDDPRRRRSLDAPRQGFGFAFRGASGLARERKRWSVCGGERRADLDLETIWED